MKNKPNHQLKTRFSFLLLFICLLIFNQCKKDIELPNDQSKLLIGHWLIQSQKGTVVTNNPAAMASDVSDFRDIVFKSNGKYRESKLLINDGDFNVVTGISKLTGKEANIIKYSKKNEQSFKISNDSLYLYDELGPWTTIYIKR